MSVWRYQWLGPWQGALEQTDPTATVVALGPVPFVDIAIAVDATRPDLDDAMEAQGWVLVGPAVGPIQAASSAFARVSAITSTTSSVYVTLLSIPFDCASAGRLVLQAAFAARATVGVGVFFALYLDSAEVQVSGTPIALEYAGALLHVEDVAAGLHTIELRWHTLVAGTIMIDPVTSDCGSLLVQFS